MSSIAPFTHSSLGTNPEDWQILDPFSPSRIFPLIRKASSDFQETQQALAPLMAADIIESGTDYHVHVDLPGVDHVDVTVENNVLQINAERKVVHQDDTDTLHSVERTYGKVQRRLTIPATG